MDLAKFDLADVPMTEDDEYEFKSGSTPPPQLGEKLAKAASAFANTGGGYFIVGIDDKTGEADGGVPSQIGRDSVRDWADKHIHRVEPPVRYEIAVITDVHGRGQIDNGKCLLVVRIEESHVGPHMAPDHKYYIRAGAHTVAARHFLIEAIRAKRHFLQPRLAYSFRRSVVSSVPFGMANMICLEVIALNDSPALDVSVLICPWPSQLQKRKPYDPININVIDRNRSASIQLCLETNDVQQRQLSISMDTDMKIEYRDVLGNQYVMEKGLKYPDFISFDQ